VLGLEKLKKLQLINDTRILLINNDGGFSS